MRKIFINGSVYLIDERTYVKVCKLLRGNSYHELNEILNNIEDNHKAVVTVDIVIDSKVPRINL